MSSNIFHEELSSMHHDVLQETPNKHPLFASEDAQAGALLQISSWIDDLHPTNQILWVYGQTASERRSVAQTVVDACRTSGRLGASFFFEGGVQRCEEAHLFPSIANQLATNIPDLEISKDSATCYNPVLPLKSISDQFHWLIARPVQDKAPLPKSYVLVIDGLDRCAGAKNVQSVLNCLADAVNLKLPFRYLITSGMQDNISQAFDCDRLRNITLRIPLQRALQAADSSHFPAGDHPSILPPFKRSHLIKRPLQFFSYPRIVTLHQRNGYAESYCRSLLLAGHGFPIFRPQSIYPAPAEYFVEGVKIGDVGVIDDHGFFQFYFNIFHPPDDIINKSHTPREFRPIEPPLQLDEVRCQQEYFKPGQVIASKGVIMKEHSENPLDVSFTSTELDGAILILPSGASREDLISTDRFHEYARKNAPHWYQYINHYSYTSYANGSLFLVTGCDKTSEWAMACFPYHVGTEKTLDLRYTWTPNYGIPWDDPGTAYTDYYPLRPSSSGNERNKNQCVFLRGLQISLTQQSWQKTLPYDERAKRHYSFILRTPSKFQVRLNSVLVFLRLRLSEERAIDIVSQRNAHLFHPNYVISQVLLAEYPDAELAVLDDTIWCSLVDNEMCTMIEMNALVTKILCHYKIVENNGIISLQAKTSDELDQDTKSPKTPDRSLPFSLFNSQSRVRAKHRPVRWVKSVPVYDHAKLFFTRD